MSAHDLSVDGGDARGRRVAIHMCIRMRWKRHARDRDRATTYRAWRKGCCGFRARAPEDGASTRAERLLLALPIENLQSQKKIQV